MDLFLPANIKNMPPKVYYFFLICLLLRAHSQAKVTKNDTKSFSCAGKVIGGYYADVQSNCQMFHVCTLANEGKIQDIVFRCLNGTVFEQETRVCEREAEVDCSQSEKFYHLNNELYGPGIIPVTALDTLESDSSATKQVLDPTDVLMGRPSPGILSVDPPTTNTDSQASEPPTSTVISINTDPPDPSPFKPVSQSPITPIKLIDSQHSRFDLPNTPDVPLIVTRTTSSSSVTASARVHIQTPFSRISLRQGADPKQKGQPPPPAPHLRPSLLKLAAENKHNSQTNSSRKSRDARFNGDPLLAFGRRWRKLKRRHRRHTKQTFHPLDINEPFPNTSASYDSFPSSLRRFSFQRHFRDIVKVVDDEDGSTGRLTNNGRDDTASHSDFKKYHGETRSQGLSKTKSPAKTVKKDLAHETEESDIAARHCKDKVVDAIYADYDANCNSYYVCNWDTILRTFKLLVFSCPERHQIFNPMLGKCSSAEEFDCTKDLSPFIRDKRRISDEKYIISMNQLEKEEFCSKLSKNTFVADIDLNCHKYISCAETEKRQIDITVHTCPFNYIFSQKQQVCRSPSRINCLRETIPEIIKLKLWKRARIDYVGDNLHLQKSFRQKRTAIFLEDSNRQKEASNSAFKEVAKVIDHPTLIRSAHGRSVQSLGQTEGCEKKIIRDKNVIREVCQSLNLTITSIVPVVQTNVNGESGKNESKNSTIEIIDAIDLPDDINITSLITAENSTEALIEEEITTFETVTMTDTTTTSGLEKEETTLAVTDQMTDETTTSTPMTTTTTTTTTTTPVPIPSSSPIPLDEPPETNFTCKDKQLDTLYPDIESGCKVFHYCASGVDNDQVLIDFKFTCTHNTIFDIKTQKCENQDTVVCGQLETTTEIEAGLITTSSQVKIDISSTMSTTLIDANSTITSVSPDINTISTSNANITTGSPVVPDTNATTMVTDTTTSTTVSSSTVTSSSSTTAIDTTTDKATHTDSMSSSTITTTIATTTALEQDTTPIINEDAEQMSVETTTIMDAEFISHDSATSSSIRQDLPANKDTERNTATTIMVTETTFSTSTSSKEDVERVEAVLNTKEPSTEMPTMLESEPPKETNAEPPMPIISSLNNGVGENTTDNKSIISMNGINKSENAAEDSPT